MTPLTTNLNYTDILEELDNYLVFDDYNNLLSTFDDEIEAIEWAMNHEGSTIVYQNNVIWDKTIDMDNWASCSWCNEYFPVSDLVDSNLGKLCSQCRAAIKSRGEELTIFEAFDDDISFYFLENTKKKKKDPTKGSMGYFTSFLPDKEKGMTILNKNLDITISNDSSSSTSTENSTVSTGSEAVGCSESLLVEDRLINPDGTLTRKAQILIDIYENDGKFSRKELLKRSGYPNWDKNGHWSTQWSDFTNKGLIVSRNGKVFAGPELETWVLNNDALNIPQKITDVKKTYQDKIAKELKKAGITQIDNNVAIFSDDYFNS